MRFYKTVFLLVINFSVYAQQNFGIKIDVGSSYLSTKVFQTGNPQTTTTQAFYFMPSFQGGIFYNLYFGKKSLFGAEILFNQINGKEHSNTPEINFNGTGNISVDFSRHISYLSIPIYYGYNFGKLNVNLGLQTSLLLYSTMQSNAKDTYNGAISTYQEKSKVPVKQADFGARINLFYPLSNKFSMDLTYYCGLINTYKYPQFGDTYRAQQITLGLRYTFLTVKKKDIK